MTAKLEEIDEMAKLIDQARALGPMTDDQRREQAASFAFGNLALTSAWSDKPADELARLRETCRRMAGCAPSESTLEWDELAAIENGDPITAIKLLRGRTGCGLNEARQQVEATPAYRAYASRRSRSGWWCTRDGCDNYNAATNETCRKCKREKGGVTR